MNLTIFALHSSILTMSPLFQGIQAFNIQKSSFRQFISPIIYNSYGRISCSLFTQGLSSVITINGEMKLPAKVDLSDGRSFELIDTVFERINAKEDPLLSIQGPELNTGKEINIDISGISFINCESTNSDGIFYINSSARTSIRSNCIVSCYSNGGLFYLRTPGLVSFTTAIDVSSTSSDTVYKIDNSDLENFQFQNINISQSNTLRYGAFWAVNGSSASVKFFTFDSSYDNYAIRVGQNSDFSMETCQFLDLTVDDSIFLIGSSINVEGSYFFGLIFDDFVLNETDSIITFSNCGFNIDEGLIKESFILFKNCLFAIQITLSIKAEFLNSYKCEGYQLHVEEPETSKFLTEEVAGIIICVVGIVICVLLMIVKTIKMNAKKGSKFYEDDEGAEYEDEFSDSYSYYSSGDGEMEDLEESQPKKRK